MFITSGLVCLLNPDQGYSEGSMYKRNWSRNFLKQFTRQNIKRQNRKLYSQKTKKQKSEPIKIRIRTLSGSVSSGPVTVKNNSQSILWNKWGIEQSELKYK